MRTIQISEYPVSALVFSPDGLRLAVGCTDCAIRILRHGGGLTYSKDDAGLTPRSLAFSPDGRWLAAFSNGEYEWDSFGGFRVRDTFGAGLAFESAWTEYDPEGWVAFTPDGDSLLLANRRLECREVGTWNRQMLRRCPMRPYCHAFAPSGDLLLAGQHEEAVFKDLRTGKIRRRLRLFHGTETCRHIAIDPTGRFIAAGLTEVVRVFRADTAKQVLTLKRPKEIVTSLAFRADGDILGVGGGDGTVRFYETCTWAESAAYDWGIGKWAVFAFSPDGLRAAAGAVSGEVVIWDTF